MNAVEKKLPRHWGILLLGAIAFAVAHTQAPLYYSNQHQYFLHGLAQAGRGDLARDWLANTRDPTPVFSAVIAFTVRYLGESWFHVEYFVLLGAYFVSLVALGTALLERSHRGPGSRRHELAGFLTALVVIHAAVVRLWSVHLTKTDYPWYLQCGVAGQYVLGPGLQPSAFGVLLLASLAAFVHGRLVLAAALVAAAATMHATYLLPGAMLTLAYLHVLWWGGRRRACVLFGAGTLLAVLPVAVHSYRAFAPTSPEQFAEARRLLAEFRIPHHTNVGRWLDGIAWCQVGWMALAIALVAGARLFPLLAIPALLGTALTLLQWATHSVTLALLFPWRISAVLMPVATAVIFARLTSLIVSRLAGRLVVGVSVAALLAVTAGGVVVDLRGLGYAVNEDEAGVIEFVRTHRQPGDVYLIPVTVPKLTAGARGSVSVTFLPPPRSRPGATLIPVDLQRFRLATGAPIYGDFKSVPYEDVEVLEWRRRIEQCQHWYDAADWDRVRDELLGERVTHVITTVDRDAGTSGLERVYADEAYRVYRVPRAR